MSRDIHTSIEIDAPPMRVWEVLTSFGDYADWNPLIVDMRAEAKVGATADFTIMIGSLQAKVQSTVMRVDAGRDLTLAGPRSALQRPLFHGEHFWRLEPAGIDGTRLVHGEHFGGVALPLLWWWLEPKIRVGYQAMNEALKRRAETTATNPAGDEDQRSISERRSR